MVSSDAATDFRDNARTPFQWDILGTSRFYNRNALDRSEPRLSENQCRGPGKRSLVGIELFPAIDRFTEKFLRILFMPAIPCWMQKIPGPILISVKEKNITILLY